MGRLAGFKYREVARKLRSFGFTFDRPVRAATKSGGTPKPVVKSRCPIIAVIWQKERSALFCAKPESMWNHFWKPDDQSLNGGSQSLIQRTEKALCFSRSLCQLRAFMPLPKL